MSTAWAVADPEERPTQRAAAITRHFMSHSLVLDKDHPGPLDDPLRLVAGSPQGEGLPSDRHGFKQPRRRPAKHLRLVPGSKVGQVRPDLLPVGPVRRPGGPRADLV